MGKNVTKIFKLVNEDRKCCKTNCLVKYFVMEWLPSYIQLLLISGKKGKIVDVQSKV